MAKFKHPSSLNAWLQYRQAVSVLKHTSRANNPGWYTSAMDIDLQCHIRVDGEQVVTAYFDKTRDTWTQGPDLDYDFLLRNEDFSAFTDEVMAHAKSQKANALGVILHIADEFATTELDPELNNPGALPELRQQIQESPSEILEDSNANAEESSFRVVPYDAAGSDIIGTAVTTSRQYEPFIHALRTKGEDSNFPIITQSLSAPLIALCGLFGLLQKQPEKPFVVILQYPWFTGLAFFNEHADLKLVRSLQHRGTGRANNLRNAIFTTSTSVEFMDPDLFILPMAENVDAQVQGDLKSHFSNSLVETLKLPSKDGLPAWCTEPGILSDRDSITKDNFTSVTVTNLIEEGWAFQDFLQVKKEVAEIYPNRVEMGMLRITRLVRLVIFILALSGLGYFGWQMFAITKKEEWSYDGTRATAATQKLAELDRERDLIVHWGNLMDDRSKSWMEMEFFAQLFPANSHMLVKDMQYSIQPEKTQGQGRVGFVKVWKIDGLARDPAIEHLNQLNSRKGANDHFNRMAEITKCDAYRTDIGSRNITINVKTRENRSFRDVVYEELHMQDESSYPFSIEITITQRFEATDPMAISTQSSK